MNYEQKYKDAIERAKKELAVCGSQDCDAARQIFRLFPELAEPEDERIRKELKRAIAVALDYSYFDKDTADNCIAWLEKQSEQKPVISDGALREGITRFGITQYQIDNWLKKYIIGVEKQGKKGGEEWQKSM